MRNVSRLILLRLTDIKERNPSYSDKHVERLVRKTVNEQLDKFYGQKKPQWPWDGKDLRINATLKKYRYFKPIYEYLNRENKAPTTDALLEHTNNIMDMTGCDIKLLYRKKDQPKSIYILTDEFYEQIAETVKCSPLTVSKMISAFAKHGIVEKHVFRGRGRVSICMDGYFVFLEHGSNHYWRKYRFLNKQKHAKIIRDFLI